MSVAVLSIGTELTRGELVNSNAAWLAARLSELGFEVRAMVTVDDHRGRIVEAIKSLCAAHRVVVATGGLGPTSDDLTSASAAEALGVALERHEGAFDAMRRRFERLGRAMSPLHAKQADLPAGAEVLLNPVGTAPGFRVSLGPASAFFLPGVPHEMQRLWEEHVAPRLRPLAPDDRYLVRLRTFGLPESEVAERLEGLEAAHPGLLLAYRASYPEVEVKVQVCAASREAAREASRAAADEVRRRLGEAVYGEGDDTFPEVVGRALRTRGWRLALAESCTGGLIGHLMTAQPASEFFVADAVTYANSAKSRLLGVGEEVLRAHGAVSAEVAAAMARGVRRACDVDVALAVTGIAGPSGGSPEKPVGLVFWSVAHPAGVEVRERVLPGDRAQIQRLAAYVGLAFLREVCRGDAG
ncbi:MAG TPA: CinA family nicotinamide mononucleotide deamidase-related protein [Polyangiaceae bacterium]|nr:CinA family nicotinamide mononucleotide deamidase-related protein [Polyangiaceae bacterium]